MKTLRLTQNLGVMNVALNRPEKRNAFQPEMIRELTQVFAGVESDPTVRAVLLTGEGVTFCAGGDLEWMKSMAQFTRDENLRDAEGLFDMFATIRSCPVPLIGRIHGHAMGGGLGLVALCDIVAAESRTVFCFSEVKWGLVPSVISPFVREKMEHRWAHEWMLTARTFTAADAQRASLIQFHGDTAQVDAYIEETLNLLNQAAPGALRETKKILLAQSQVDWKEMRRLTCQVIADRRVSAEGQRGLQAFLEKKNPNWTDLYGPKSKI